MSRLINSTTQVIQTIYVGEILCLFTVTFWVKRDFSNSISLLLFATLRYVHKQTTMVFQILSDGAFPGKSQPMIKPIRLQTLSVSTDIKVF